MTPSVSSMILSMEKAFETKIARRSFITGAIYTLSSLITAALGGSAGAYLFGKPRTQKQSAWVDAGETPELHPGSPQEITFDRNRIDGWKVRNEKASAWVILNPDGELTAFSPLCTHLGCAYQWEPKQKCFSCPCHGSSFSETGAVLTGPATRPLDRYAIKTEGSRLWLGPIQTDRNA